MMRQSMIMMGFYAAEVYFLRVADPKKGLTKQLNIHEEIDYHAMWSFDEYHLPLSHLQPILNRM